MPVDDSHQLRDEDVVYLRVDSWMELPLHPWSSLASQDPLIVLPLDGRWVRGQTSLSGAQLDIDCFRPLENGTDVPPVELFHECVSHPNRILEAYPLRYFIDPVCGLLEILFLRQMVFEELDHNVVRLTRSFAQLILTLRGGKHGDLRPSRSRSVSSSVASMRRWSA